jgi:peptide/nickel transport system substrate-binding protein
MKLRHLALVALLMLAILIAGCAQATPTAAPTPKESTDTSGQTVEKTVEPTQAPEPTEAPASNERANVFIYGHPITFPDLDPAISFSNDSAVLSNCYETLTFYNPPNSADVLSPGLATSWKANDAGTEWIFHLREGVKFQDGEPFNAEAVKYSIDKTMELGMGASYIWDPVKDIEVVDDNTVKFILSYAAPLDLIASSGYGAWIYSPKTYEAHDSEWFNAGHCAGTGPYSIESRERGSRLVMTRNDDYWGGWKEDQFDKIVFEISEDPVVLQQMIEGGTVDFTYGVPPDNIDALSTHDDLVVYTNPSFQNLLGLMNNQKPPLDNKLVRQAISYSFPYKQFIDGVMNGRATQAHGPVPAGMWGHSDDLFQYHYDLDKAKALLAEAGYPDGGFDLLYTFSTGDMDEQQLGEVWKAELAKLGINLEIQGMTWEAQWDLAKSGPENAQDIFAFYWWPDYVSPYSFLYNIFHSEDDILFNLGYYRNPDFDKLIDEANALSGSDREKAAELFIKAQEMLADDAAAMFFYDVNNTHIARNDIQGFVDNPAYPHVVFVYQLSRK